MVVSMRQIDYNWSNPEHSDHEVAGQRVRVTTWEGQTPGGSYMYRAILTKRDDSWTLKMHVASSGRNEVRDTVLRQFRDAL